jgi:hypothetical protein
MFAASQSIQDAWHVLRLVYALTALAVAGCSQRVMLLATAALMLIAGNPRSAT